MSRVEAAEYIGVSVGLFDTLVADGRMPRPKEVNSRRIWDRRQLEKAFSAIGQVAAGAFDDLDPLEKWQAEQAAKEACSEQEVPSTRRLREENEKWERSLLGKPIGVREKRGLASLRPMYPNWVTWDDKIHVTLDAYFRLKARGFIVAKEDDQASEDESPSHYGFRRRHRFRLTDTGLAAANLIDEQ